MLRQYSLVGRLVGSGQRQLAAKEHDQHHEHYDTIDDDKAKELLFVPEKVLKNIMKDGSTISFVFKFTNYAHVSIFCFMSPMKMRMPTTPDACVEADENVKEQKREEPLVVVYTLVNPNAVMVQSFYASITGTAVLGPS